MEVGRRVDEGKADPDHTFASGNSVAEFTSFDRAGAGSISITGIFEYDWVRFFRLPIRWQVDEMVDATRFLAFPAMANSLAGSGIGIFDRRNDEIGFIVVELDRFGRSREHGEGKKEEGYRNSVAGHDSIDVDKFIQIKKTQGELLERCSLNE